MNIGIVEFRDNTSDVLGRVAYGGERMILEKKGRPIAAIVSLDDLALIEAAEEREDVRAARKARKEKGAIPLAEVIARRNQRAHNRSSADKLAARKAMNGKPMNDKPRAGNTAPRKRRGGNK